MARSKRQNRITLLTLCLIFLAYIVYNGFLTDNRPVTQTESQYRLTDLSVLEAAARKRQSDIQVTQQGKVLRVLPDDNEGSRHQRFIVGLTSSQTVLVSHNIDLAPRIPGLSDGDEIIFCGEYEWNDRGGVIHWTHHDPKGRHVDGWIRFRGKVYQ